MPLLQRKLLRGRAVTACLKPYTRYSDLLLLGQRPKSYPRPLQLHQPHTSCAPRRSGPDTQAASSSAQGSFLPRLLPLPEGLGQAGQRAATLLKEAVGALPDGRAGATGRPEGRECRWGWGRLGMGSKEVPLLLTLGPLPKPEPYLPGLTGGPERALGREVQEKRSLEAAQAASRGPYGPVAVRAPGRAP